METFSELMALCSRKSPVTGGFNLKRPVTWSFNVFCDLRLNKPLSKENASDLKRHRANLDVIVLCLIRSLTAKKSPFP